MCYPNARLMYKMKATIILGIIAIIAALGAVTLLIRTQEVSAQQSPSQIDQIPEQALDSLDAARKNSKQ